MSTRGLYKRGFGRTGVVLAFATLLLLGTGAVPAFPVPAKPAPPPAPPAAPEQAVRSVVPVPIDVRHVSDPAARNYTPTATHWPAARSAHLTVAPSMAAGQSGPATTSAGLPVAIRPAAVSRSGFGQVAGVDVTILDHSVATAAGISGVVFSVHADIAGVATIGLDYSGFAEAYGGNFGSRLRLETLPACALTTPNVPSCRIGTPVRSDNQPTARTVSTTLAIPGGSGSNALVMAALTGSGDDGGANGGTYSATTLKPEGSWTSGGSTGSFDYTYPIASASARTGLVPDMTLSYDSGSVDGQTATTQAQASWVGDGWSTPESYVEQTFVSCANNPEGTASPKATGDMCYAGPILTLSIDGSSTSLVWDKTAKIWRDGNDSGWVIKHVTTGGDNGTGTYNHDYWTVTETNGTVYSFGLNHLPGWAAGKTATNSVDSEPVYSAHPSDNATQEPTDPCYNAAGFDQSVCTMAYRWNLDYVTDVHGGAMAFYYGQSTNSYGENNGTSTVSYVRDSYLKEIDYGFTTATGPYGSIPDAMVFKTAGRCVAANCEPLSATTKSLWPDVPFDLVCSSSCTSNTSPSFFSTVRLTEIDAEQYLPSAGILKPVDTYVLTQTLPAVNGNGTSPTLWLTQVQRTGLDLTGTPGNTTTIQLPPTKFDAVANALPNRTDLQNGLAPFYRNRIGMITTETGSQITVSYYLPKPCTTPVTITPSANTFSCFPVEWTPGSVGSPILDWFNKYAVQQVQVHSPTGGEPDQLTTYSYDKPAWHYDDNELVQTKYRTYGQFRGYQDVKTFMGDGVNDQRTESEAQYYQGMSRDNNTTTVNLTDSQGGVHEDLNQLSGRPLETTTYQGENGPVDHSTIGSYWVGPARATRTRTGLPDLVATKTLPIETYTRQATTSTGAAVWRYLETDTSYDSTATDANYGQPLYVYQHTVPIQAAYSSCVANSYAPANTTANLIGLSSGGETDSVACGGFTEGTHPSAPNNPTNPNTLTAPSSVSRPAQVMSATETFYDDPTYSTTFPQTAAPTKGDVTMTRSATDYSSGFQWQTAARTAYDSIGRVVTSYDGNDNPTTTVYTDSSVGLTTQVKVTNAASQSTTTVLDTERAAPTSVTDPNSIVTTVHLDALGRTTAVWKYSRAPASTPANLVYTYLVQQTGVTALTTQILNDASGYTTSVTLYDADLRVRQTQSQTPVSLGDRLVSDTFYDSRGWVSSTNNAWYNSSSAPNTTIVAPQDHTDPVPNQDYFTYDGLGRQIADAKYANYLPVTGQVTRTIYNGDRTTAVPPVGGVVQTTLIDPLGRTTELDQYNPTAPTVSTPSNTFTGYFTLTIGSGTTRPVFYGYDGHGRQATTQQGIGGATWTSSYNLVGQITEKIDPDGGDTGANALQYDKNGNLLQQTDGRGKTTSFTYDVLNRKTGEYDSDRLHQVPGASGNQIAAWIYDNTNSFPGMTDAIGQMTAETVYWNNGSFGGQAYTLQQKSFNVFGESTGQIVTIPSGEGNLAGTYTFNHSYTTTTGLPFKDQYAAQAGLPAETLTHTYGAMDLPSGYSSALGTYANTTTYDSHSRVFDTILGAGTNLATITNTFDDTTNRLTDQSVKPSSAPAAVDNEHYDYDPSGHIVKQIDTRSSATETQCYGYATQDELTAAWTATDNCAATPTTASHAMVGDPLGSSSAYWTTWTFNNTTTVGNGYYERASQTQHAFTGGPGSDVTTNYAYNGNGANQPHTLTSAGTGTYSYDAAGNMATRNAGQGNQTLHWDDAGRLVQISGGTAGTTNFKYDAGGNLLIQQDPTSTILYLPTEQITLTGTTVTGVRYYPLPGGQTAVRTGTATNAYTYQLPDQQGTPMLYLDSTCQVPTWRQHTPYGGPRGTTTPAPDNHGFLNKPVDTATGLAIVGARQYDATVGQFISLDPVVETSDPNQLGGYAYAGDDPVNTSDPTGLCRDDPGTPCGDGHPHDGNGVDGAPKAGHPCGVCGAYSPTMANQCTRIETYCLGPPTLPVHLTGADDFYKYDPKAKPTGADYDSFSHWEDLDRLCGLYAFFGQGNQGPNGCSDISHAFYDHFLNGHGEDMNYDLSDAYDDDWSIRRNIDDETRRAQAAAEALYFQTGQADFSMTGVNHNISYNPPTAKWQKTIGSYNLWGSATVHVGANGVVTMTFTAHAVDRYNFNPNSQDISTHVSDSVNGRFETLGWAHSFDSYGSMTRTVTWTLGAASSATTSPPTTYPRSLDNDYR